MEDKHTMRVKVWARRTHQGKPCSMLIKQYDEPDSNPSRDPLAVLPRALEYVRRPHYVECFVVITSANGWYRESLQWTLNYS